MTIDTSDQRTRKALAALPRAGQWLKVRDQAGRALAYGVPSATVEALYHFATASQCTCEDHRRGNLCWHARAVAMHVAAMRVQPKTRRGVSLSSCASQALSRTTAVAERPVLDMIRHADGEISWTRHDHTDGNITYLPRRPVRPASPSATVSPVAPAAPAAPVSPVSDQEADRIFSKL